MHRIVRSAGRCFNLGEWITVDPQIKAPIGAVSINPRGALNLTDEGRSIVIFILDSYFDDGL